MKEETIVKVQDTMDKVAELLEYKLTFNFKSTGRSESLELAELPAETIAILLDYGTRKLNDKVNSIYAMPSNEATREAIVARVLEEAKAGKLGERRSGGIGNTGLRNFILTWLRANGKTAKELETLKGATPQAVINTIYAKRDDAAREAILAEFTKRYEASLQAESLLEIDF